jgi:hypothetical protein
LFWNGLGVLGRVVGIDDGLQPITDHRAIGFLPEDTVEHLQVGHHTLKALVPSSDGCPSLHTLNLTHGPTSQAIKQLLKLLLRTIAHNLLLKQLPQLLLIGLLDQFV